MWTLSFHDGTLVVRGAPEAALAALPSDFDGDGGMDVVVLTREIAAANDEYEALVLWGEHDQQGKKHKLVCPEEAAEKGNVKKTVF